MYGRMEHECSHTYGVAAMSDNANIVLTKRAQHRCQGTPSSRKLPEAPNFNPACRELLMENERNDHSYIQRAKRGQDDPVRPPRVKTVGPPVSSNSRRSHELPGKRGDPWRTQCGPCPEDGPASQRGPAWARHQGRGEKGRSGWETHGSGRCRLCA